MCMHMSVTARQPTSQEDAEDIAIAGAKHGSSISLMRSPTPQPTCQESAEHDAAHYSDAAPAAMPEEAPHAVPVAAELAGRQFCQFCLGRARPRDLMQSCTGAALSLDTGRDPIFDHQKQGPILLDQAHLSTQ
jgi:hypothetical protein